MREKQIQIPERLFAQMAFFVMNPDKRTAALEKEILDGIETKMDAISKHELYTKSKTAPSAEEKEKARKEYLDRVGMRDSFRW